MRPAAPALGLILAAAACSRAARDPVRAMLDELAAAAEARDADRALARISDRFQGRGAASKAEIATTLRRYFAAYESIGIELHGVEVDHEDGTARIRCVVAFSGQARKAFGLEGLLPPSAAYRFELEAANENDTWRVTRAAWEPAEAASPAAP
ncbi:MAG TPA: hypothetical protein VGQ78_09515 [Vicinamibacteria bacterium]|nr:hypothetical protein [Vicinamibacteria bacterium]